MCRKKACLTIRAHVLKNMIFEINLVNNCTFNVQSHYINIAFYFYLQRNARQFFSSWIVRKYRKIKRIIISKSRQAPLPIFRTVCFVINCSCFLPFLVLRFLPFFVLQEKVFVRFALHAHIIQLFPVFWSHFPSKFKD